MKGAQDFLASFKQKKNVKINNKKFFQLEVRNSIKTQNEQKLLRIYVISSPPQYLAFYAKIFLVISTIYSTAFVIQGSFLENWDKTQALT